MILLKILILFSSAYSTISLRYCCIEQKKTVKLELLHNEKTVYSIQGNTENELTVPAYERLIKRQIWNNQICISLKFRGRFANERDIKCLIKAVGEYNIQKLKDKEEFKTISSSTVPMVKESLDRVGDEKNNNNNKWNNNAQFLLQIGTLMAVALLGFIIIIISALFWCSLRKILLRKNSWDTNQNVLQSSPDFLPSYDKAVTESKNTWTVHGNLDEF
ncbi:DgyrCDS13912 [Dimorphilus gyrociliatus]|uniref:DgyrCDS13912 n=1 Tax=Dimorphilus gyrociliatus TaxID=2664684 RepID=A0A7I8WC14_9ANNE|nr:DgyrCDS13912 [Dimorphilus gyrociliatus]